MREGGTSEREARRCEMGLEEDEGGGERGRGMVEAVSYFSVTATQCRKSIRYWRIANGKAIVVHRAHHNSNRSGAREMGEWRRASRVTVSHMCRRKQSLMIA